MLRNAKNKRRVILITLQKRMASLSESSLERFLYRARRAAKVTDGVDVLVTSSERMRAMNRQFRGKDKATDVLSFPSFTAMPNKRRRAHAGEIAISGDIAAQNALRFGHTTAEEVKILILHGILHLAGFDHERDNGEMARKEMKLRQALRLPVALIERNSSASHSRTSKKAGHHTSASAMRRRA
jgi:probable rRNA maturation factor